MYIPLGSTNSNDALRPPSVPNNQMGGPPHLGNIWPVMGGPISQGTRPTNMMGGPGKKPGQQGMMSNQTEGPPMMPQHPTGQGPQVTFFFFLETCLKISNQECIFLPNISSSPPLSGPGVGCDTAPTFSDQAYLFCRVKVVYSKHSLIFKDFLNDI